ncbi:MAG TPA: hypothetical protein VH595_16265 [Verrucomicrobiae bacterium]|nr:hypothetical protein [Verrucomicrobiae bacterium]
MRVIKPGGCLTIIDIRHTAEYAEVLRQSKMSDVRRTGPNFLFVIPTYTLIARKAA